MSTSSENHQSDHTLLMVISSKMDTLIDRMKNIEEKMESKVHFADFKDFKDRIERDFLVKSDFVPVKNLVYGTVTIILTIVLSGLVYLIVKH